MSYLNAQRIAKEIDADPVMASQIKQFVSKKRLLQCLEIGPCDVLEIFTEREMREAKPRNNRDFPEPLLK